MTLRRYYVSLFVLAVGTLAVQADFFLPTTWTRPAASGTNNTFQGWEIFTSATGPNAPQTVPGPAFGGAGNWAPINPGGTANAFDSNAPGNGSFVTGGGNIYNPAGLVAPRAIVPNNIDLTAGTNNAGWTTLVFQLRTQGGVLDINSGRLNGTIVPVSVAVPFNQPISGGFGGVVREYWLQFQVPGNADTYQFDIAPLETSVSFDRLAVDTAWNPTAASQGEAFLEPTPLSAVPEPATWAMIGLVAAAAGVVAYRRHRLQVNL
jgi:hypothetical protein